MTSAEGLVNRIIERLWQRYCIAICERWDDKWQRVWYWRGYRYMIDVIKPKVTGCKPASIQAEKEAEND